MALSAVDKPNTMTSFSAEDDLDKVWEETIVRCNKIFKLDLNEEGNVTIDQILFRINQPKSPKPEVKDKAKKVFNNALVCVQRFGCLIAQSASVVFGPSQQCFNAISFVINAVQDYDAVFNNLTVLMERVSTFLERMRVFLDDTEAETRLDKRLRRTVYDVLDHFITIMGLAHRLTRGWKGKLKLAAKIGAFGEDDGVRDAMARLETLISNETDMEISVIAKDLSEAAKNIRGMDKKLDQIADAQEKTNRDVGHLVTAEQRRAADEEEKKRLGKIREVLNIDATKRPWVDRQDELQDKHIEGTGDWLLKYRSFSRWSNPNELSTKVLTVKANEGYGKSHLCSIVISHLQEKHREDPRVVVAYYYFQRDVQDKNPVNKAMKTIIYQLVSASTSVAREYAKLVHKACERKTDFGKTTYLWERLIADLGKSLDATFFILLDGVDEDEVEPLGNIVSQVLSGKEDSQLKIRLFMTGRPNGLDSLARHVSREVDSEIPEITIARAQPSLNQSDIMLYAEQRLNDMDIFKYDDKENANLQGRRTKVVELKERARNELGEGVQGDYFALDMKLNELSQSRTFRDVEETLSLAQEDRSQAIAREINQLNDNLREDEIQEVNTLLAWQSVCYQNFSVDQFEAVLRLEADDWSLVSLAKQISDRYSSLFDVSDGKKPDDKIVTLKSYDIKEYLRGKDELPSSRYNLGRRPDATLSEGEVTLVKRILKTHFLNIFGADDMYDKFGFEEFFESKVANQAARIRLVSDVENHAKVAQACLAVACDHPEEDAYRGLRSYALDWFAFHLGAIRFSLEEVGTLTKQDIGRKLVRMLRDERLISTWWKESQSQMLIQQWAYEKWCIDCVGTWLRDPIVQKSCSDTPSERQWVARTTGTPADLDPPVRLLETVAQYVARQWLAREPGRWYDAFVFLHGYLSLLERKEPDYWTDPTAEEAGVVEAWAREAVPDVDEVARHRCMAETFRKIRCYKESIARFREALEVTPKQPVPDHWRIVFGLAEALGMKQQHKEAVQTLEKLIEDNPDLHTVDEEFEEMYWDTMLDLIGEWNMDMNNFAAAELTYQKMLDECKTKTRFEFFGKNAALMMTKVLDVQSKHQQTVDLLLDLEKRVDDGGNWLSNLLGFYADTDELHQRIFTAAHNVDQWQELTEKYRAAVDALRSDDSEFGAYMHLRLWLGLLLWAHSSREEKEAALDMWEEDLNAEVPDDADDVKLVSWARTMMAPRLAVALLDSAKYVGLSTPLSPAAEEYATRLEKLTHGDPDYVRGTFDDVRIALARLHHLAGDDARAKDIVRDLLRTGIQIFEERDFEDCKDGLYRIAVVLQAMDDDINAIAAWRCFKPKTPSDSDDSSSSSSEDGRSSVGKVDQETASTSATQSVADEREGQGDEQAVAGAERDGNSSLVADDLNHEEQESVGHGLLTESEQEQPPETDPQGSGQIEKESNNPKTPPEDLNDDPAQADKNSIHTVDDDIPDGILDNHCIGMCGTTWTYVDNLYSCKDCLDFQFESKCYAKLQNGTLNPTICSKNHNFIHIPPFDKEKWLALGEDEMYVGEEVVKMKDWLEGIKRDWQLDEESLRAREKKMSAAKKIQMAWRVYKRLGLGRS